MTASVKAATRQIKTGIDIQVATMELKSGSKINRLNGRKLTEKKSRKIQSNVHMRRTTQKQIKR
jgi:hypothetical protein